MSAAKLIALTGVSGAGKDAAGSHLAREHGYCRIAVADPLKTAMMGLFGLTREQLWGGGRNLPDPRLGRAPRELYQQFGAACREIDADVWIRAFRQSVAATLGDGGRVVCTDLRTVAELGAVRELGGTVWRVVRAGAGAPGAMALDSTETELAGEPVDLEIPNDGTLADLHAWLDRVLAAQS